MSEIEFRVRDFGFWQVRLRLRFELLICEEVGLAWGIGSTISLGWGILFFISVFD